jgi:hypothetical protein
MAGPIHLNTQRGTGAQGRDLKPMTVLRRLQGTLDQLARDKRDFTARHARARCILRKLHLVRPVAIESVAYGVCPRF